jgi:chloramphenicol-sensitive protein RarD
MMNKGILYAVLAYGIWGILPIYWKSIQEVPAPQILGHRIIWSFAFLAAIVYFRKDWLAFGKAIKNRKSILIFSLSAAIISVNWLTYIWAVNAGFIVETSLGYFINPLISVLLGVVFLKEKLRTTQWVPVGLALVGVLYLTFQYGELPWIALLLATTFGLYGLIKKTAPLNSLHGMTLETGMLFIPALIFLILSESQGTGAFGHTSWFTGVLLAFTGVATALPLLLFSNAARRINLSTLGFLQYFAPTLQFLIGVLIYNEPLTNERLVGFVIIWIALILYSFEGFYTRRRAALPVPA